VAKRFRKIITQKTGYNSQTNVLGKPHKQRSNLDTNSLLQKFKKRLPNYKTSVQLLNPKIACSNRQSFLYDKHHQYLLENPWKESFEVDYFREKHEVLKKAK
jgi:hypothetical protein